MVLWLDLAPVQIAFDAVLVVLLMSTRVSLAMNKFTIQQHTYKDAIFLHAEDMPHPSELDLDENEIDVGGFSTVQDFKIRDMILPTYS